MSFAAIAVALEDSVFRITLNRPAQRNAMSLAMVEELRAALNTALTDDTVRVIMLRGAGGNFCAGGDIADMAQARARKVAEGVDPIAEMNEEFGRLCLAFAESSKPIVAVLEGAVIGGGFGLACVADVAIALADAKFRLSETSLGLIPAQIAPFLVNRLGFSTANRLALTASVLGSAAALEIGLVHEVAGDDAALEIACASVIAALKNSPPGALAATKLLMRRAMFEPATAILHDAAALFAQAVRGAEGQEGMMAFLQKRLPSWVSPG
jgi:isohexenylglutaconyl-CoA hydratase